MADPFDHDANPPVFFISHNSYWHLLDMTEKCQGRPGASKCQDRNMSGSHGCALSATPAAFRAAWYTNYTFTQAVSVFCKIMAGETTVSLAWEHWEPQTGQPAILPQNLSASVYFSCHSRASNHRAWESPELLLPSGCSFTGTWIMCPYGGTTASCLPGILLQTSNLCYHQNPSIIPTCKSPISGPTHWAGSWNVEMDLKHYFLHLWSSLPPFCTWSGSASGQHVMMHWWSPTRSHL